MSKARKLTKADKKGVKAIWQSAIIGNVIITIISGLYYYQYRDITETISIAGIASLTILAATLIVLPLYAILVRNNYEKMSLAATISWSIQFGAAIGILQILFFQPETSYKYVNLFGIIKGDASAAGVIFDLFFGVMLIMVWAYYQDKLNEQAESKNVPTAA